MTAPTDYARQGDFTDDENTNKGGRVTQDSAQLDAEFDDIERVISEITTNLNLIQRADTLINAGVVPYSALTGECISAISALNGSNVWVLRGAWSASGTDYNVNDVATNGGESFLSITDHTSGATVPADDATNWLKLSQKGTDGTAFTWQGSWVVDTNFYVNDVVEESGSTYICITDHTSDSSTFATDAAYWELMASQGTDGTSTLPTESGSSDERVLISKGAPSSRVWGYVTTTQAPTLAPLAAPALTGNATAENMNLSGVLEVTAVEGNVADMSTGTVINLAGALMQTKSLTANTTFTSTGFAEGRAIDLMITGHSADVTVAWPANWVWLTDKPASITANKKSMLGLRCYGAAETDVIAMMVVQP